MVQKKLPLINSSHGSETRNIINELIKLFNGMGYTYDKALQKAHDVLDEAQQTNDMNENVQQQINTLIAESGTSDAELLQARVDSKGKTHDVLKTRLDENDIETASNVSKNEKKTRGTLSILDFENLVIDKGKATEDWKDAMLAARDFIANQENPQKLIFPSGIYQYSESPNWNIDNAYIESDGVVRLRYTGTDRAVIIDGGEITGLVWHLHFGEFLIECPPTAKDALFVRGVHSSQIKAKILGAGQGTNESNVHYAGLRAEWCVCTDFYITCTANHEGWYMDAKPYYGIYLDKKAQQPAGQGGYMSWCNFYTPKIEHCEVGIHLERAQGTSFYGGTSEGCTDIGINISSNAMLTKIYGIDLEENTNYDIRCLGRENEFYSVDSTNLIYFDGYARSNVLTGGAHKSIEFSPTTYSNLVQAVKYNRFGAGGDGEGFMNDPSERNRLINNRNVGKNLFENRPPKTTTLTVGESPFSYKNDKGNDEKILVAHQTPGSVQKIMWIHGGIGVTLDTNVLSQIVTLSPDDTLQVTFTSKPIINKMTT